MSLLYSCTTVQCSEQKANHSKRHPHSPAYHLVYSLRVQQNLNVKTLVLQASKIIEIFGKIWNSAKAYTKNYFHLYYRETRNSKRGTTVPLQKVKLLACSASFHPLIADFLKFALKYQLMLTSHLHKEWEVIVFSGIKWKIPLKEISILSMGAKRATGRWVASARETWRRLAVYLCLYHRRWQDIHI